MKYCYGLLISNKTGVYFSYRIVLFFTGLFSRNLNKRFVSYYDYHYKTKKTRIVLIITPRFLNCYYLECVSFFVNYLLKKKSILCQKKNESQLNKNIPMGMF